METAISRFGVGTSVDRAPGFGLPFSVVDDASGDRRGDGPAEAGLLDVHDDDVLRQRRVVRVRVDEPDEPGGVLLGGGLLRGAGLARDRQAAVAR